MVAECQDQNVEFTSSPGKNGNLTPSWKEKFTRRHGDPHLPNGPHPSPRAAQHPQPLQVGRCRGGTGGAGKEQVGHGVGTLEGRRLRRQMNCGCEIPLLVDDSSRLY